jgi:hypothetical protein
MTVLIPDMPDESPRFSKLGRNSLNLIFCHVLPLGSTIAVKFYYDSPHLPTIAEQWRPYG